MGWGKDSAERLRQQQEQQRADVAEQMQNQQAIAASADALWQELTATLENDVREFTASAHKPVDFRAYSVNDNYFVVERPVQPTFKIEFVRQPGVGVTVDVSGFSFDGMTGASKELSAPRRTFRFGIGSAKRPCFVTEGGTATYPAEISAQTGALIEEFVRQYLYGSFQR